MVSQFHRIRYVVPVLVLAVMVVAAGAASAQVPTLALDTAELQSGLFEGANIILVALSAIMFLLAGLAFGRNILNAIINAVKSAF